ncbi:GGDEF domain-containing protein [Petroclostridium sp. X23]|uniref:GGDEF domain-containing protein n=1 Tax=Petroclostridium sp. X23 TaxID=3045146 RepID=UPI0024AE8067|nr:GGDEF domain-containing protein [Petroclostridium sp. X23]WHH60078.1 GGDEF domain-containing protein [Petroclostridium sp. X23]
MKKHSTFLITISLSILIFIVISVSLILNFARITKEDPYTINQIGIIRGSIQRIIKSELSGISNDELINTVDDLLNTFSNEKNSTTENNEYQTFLDIVAANWIGLKKDIYNYRINPSPTNIKRITERSEELWSESDRAVLSAQINAEKKFEALKIIFYLLTFAMLFIFWILFLIKHHIRDRLEFLVNYDELTKIYNKRFFNDYMLKEIDTIEKHNYKLCLIIFDIDHFKKINDTFGHGIGDDVLREIAEIINQNIRKSDIFARIGGEEFALILPETDIKNAAQLAERLRKAVDRNHFKKVKHITISLGVGSFSTGDSFKSLFEKADSALYAAKNNGRNRIELSCV